LFKRNILPSYAIANRTGRYIIVLVFVILQFHLRFTC